MAHTAATHVAHGYQASVKEEDHSQDDEHEAESGEAQADLCEACAAHGGDMVSDKKAFFDEGGRSGCDSLR